MRWSNSVSMVALSKYEQKVKLVNPKITAEGKNVRGRGYTNYILTADDMLPVEENK